VWIKALENASKGVKTGGPVKMNFDEYIDILGLDKNEPLTAELVSKTFRKAALKAHPDKGGDVDKVS
jgi:curved DNA-binding protein CbpA